MSDGGAVSITRVLAPNPGPMTLQGTNTWVITAPEGTVVVDPGPDDHDHLHAVIATVAGPVTAIVLTHRHHDHSAAAPGLADRLGCPVLAADPVWCRDGEPLTDGRIVGPLRVIMTPGHTDDSITLQVVDDQVLLTGDTVLGGSSTVITHPDGDVGAYLAGLDRLMDVCTATGVTRLLPGHGPELIDPLDELDARRRHRLARLDQVRAALAAGSTSVAAVTTAVHPDLAPALRPAAEQSIAAQLAHLGSLRDDDPCLTR